VVLIVHRAGKNGREIDEIDGTLDGLTRLCTMPHARPGPPLEFDA